MWLQGETYTRIGPNDGRKETNISDLSLKVASHGCITMRERCVVDDCEQFRAYLSHLLPPIHLTHLKSSAFTFFYSQGMAPSILYQFDISIYLIAAARRSPKKYLLAMIRQLRKPTMYLTISANEIRWAGLMQLLYKLKNNGVEISEETALRLDYIAYGTLINDDAVTCAVQFNELINVLSWTFFSRKKVRRFQHRDSSHAHILPWLNNAPANVLSANYQYAVALFNSLLSVSSLEASRNITPQNHKLTFTYYIRKLFSIGVKDTDSPDTSAVYAMQIYN